MVNRDAQGRDGRVVNQLVSPFTAPADTHARNCEILIRAREAKRRSVQMSLFSDFRMGTLVTLTFD